MNSNEKDSLLNEQEKEIAVDISCYHESSETDECDEVEDQSNVCRICFEELEDYTENDENEYLNPCRCKGSSKWVHRTCLNQWRAISNNGEAFYKCFSCNYRYRLQEKQLKYGYVTKFNLFLSRHPFSFYSLNLLVLFLFTIIIGNIDANSYRIPKLLHSDYNYNNETSMTTEDSSILGIPYSYFAGYYFFSTILYLIAFVIVFLFGLICMKNRYLYLSYICSHCRELSCIACCVIVFSFLNLALGTFTLTVFMQVMIKYYYAVIESTMKANEQIVLEYDPNFDREDEVNENRIDMINDDDDSEIAEV